MGPASPGKEDGDSRPAVYMDETWTLSKFQQTDILLKV
jgi:hypothetical protein